MRVGDRVWVRRPRFGAAWGQAGVIVGVHIEQFVERLYDVEMEKSGEVVRFYSNDLRIEGEPEWE